MSTELTFQPDYAASPGALLQTYLDHLDISARELARRLGRSAKLVTEILAGKAPVEPETALQLERVLNLPAQTTLTMEANYRLRLARNEEDAALAVHLPWAKAFPLKKLNERGHLQLVSSPAEQVREVLQFLGCATIEVCEVRFAELLSVKYRKSATFDSDQYSLLAWLRIGERKALAADYPAYDRAAFVATLRKIRTLTTEPFETFLPQVETLCAEAGVVFVLEPALPRVALSGISRWITPKRALIQQTLRHKSNDHFWFTFFHECAHLLLHSRKALFLDGDDVASAQRSVEDEANQWASRYLISPDALLKFLAKGAPSEADVIAFAEEEGIAPGIVVGQLQHINVLRYGQFNDLKDRHDKW